MKYLILLVAVIQFLEKHQILAKAGQEIFIKDFCESVSVPLKCDTSSKYRQINGRCNNLENPYLGAANTKFSRLMEPRYSDGKWAPPKSVTGAELPSARLVSLKVFGDADIKSIRYSHTFIQFGQFIAHSFSNVLNGPVNTKCCQNNGKLVTNPDTSCLYIPIPEDDGIHSGMTCMNFVRSLTDKDINCPNYYHNNHSEQINGATGSLDLSLIYGTSHGRLKRLRSFKNGQLEMEGRFNSSWPIHDPQASHNCYIQSPKESCYFSGDSRINQNPLLSIVHILFIREHNRIANELKNLNPHWSDEILFQEARRINIAQFQSIAYYEWLVSILGSNGLKLLGLYYQPSGGDYANDYDPSIKPVAYNDFSGAMFRLLHSSIEGHLWKLSESHKLEEIVRLSDTYFRPTFIEGYGTFENYIRGMIAQPSLRLDGNFDPEVRSYLFRQNRTYGSDLKAIDIQRGRDHGIASYNDLRAFCGLPRAVKWEDFSDQINMSHIENMRNVYASVDDVDLNVGATLENPLGGGIIIGYTYVCLVKIQITAFRSGDRFWFETSDPVVRFTPKQLEQIRKASFARIICDNTEGIFSIPKSVFSIPNDMYNPYVNCSDVPSVDLTFFKE